jgi:hypothetical protein
MWHKSSLWIALGLLTALSECSGEEARSADSAAPLPGSRRDALWNPWESLGGTVASGVSAVSWGPNRLDIFADSSDGTVWHTSWNP